jgi:hypothetical protein
LGKPSTNLWSKIPNQASPVEGRLHVTPGKGSTSEGQINPIMGANKVIKNQYF